jgi:hypothetical protein
MNEKDFKTQMNTADSVERTNLSTNNPEADSDSFAYKGPVLAGLIQQTPMGTGVVAVSPADEVIVHEDPLSDALPYNIPEGETSVLEGVISTNVGSVAPLLNQEESEHFRIRWSEIQGRFVDEPRSAVQQADTLVSDVIDKITEMFANEHGSLEGQWKEGKDVSTEDLRMALQHYRSFFKRLVV